MSVLAIRQLTMRFGGLTAVSRVDLEVEPGQIFSVIGPNGAGKTTVFNALTGIYEPAGGEMLFEDRELARPFNSRAALGIGLVAVLMGLLTIVALHLEPLWKATIEVNYRYMRPFPWGEAVLDLLGYLVDHGLGVALSGLFGAALGGGGAFVAWRRQRRAPNLIAARGICRTFQNIRLFPEMTALENVLMGMDLRLRTRLWDMALRTPTYRREEREAGGHARELLGFVGLEDRAETVARNLPYGAQRRLEVARALATRPALLLLDEPAAGMNPTETAELMKLIHRIRDTGVTVLLIEHHMKVVMGISDRIAVLDYGSKIAEGTPAEIRRDPRVIEAYLGKEEE